MIAAAGPIDADLLRLRHEFLSMPTLTLTAPQVARLLGVRTVQAAELLAALEREKLLTCGDTGLYRRAVAPRQH
jgi:hypothetical protein